MGICESNRLVASEVAAFLRNVSDVKEESITDYLIWKWREIDNRFKYLNVTAFTRHEEHATTGADFELELWLVGARNHIPMIVQAKKLWKPFDSYLTRLNYPLGTQGQLTKLLAYGRSSGRLPFYFLYALPDTDTKAMCRRNDISDCGVFVTDALTIKDIADGNRGRRISKSALLEVSNPFHCMFCCPLVQQGTYFSHYFRTLSDHQFVRSNTELPRYVRLLLSDDFRLMPGQGDPEAAKAYDLPLARIVAAYDGREGSNEAQHAPGRAKAPLD
jgi:hypothetical protein